MEDEQSFKLTKSAEQDKWLDEHIVLNRRFIEEARKYKIKPLTNEFWVYYHHRDYEVYGKYGWCVAGISQMAEDCGITQRQVENSYYQLVQKGAIQHIWCESRVYRSKSKVYASSVLLKDKGILVTNKNLSDGRERKLPNYKEAVILDQNLADTPANLAGKSANLAGKSANLAGKSDLNNTNNNTNNIEERKKERSYESIFKEKQVDGDLKEAFLEFIKSRNLNKKKLTDRALELSIDKVRKLSQDRETQIAIINQSIERGWQGLFPVEDNKNNRGLEVINLNGVK